jgi:hypothetical protein
MTKHEFLAFIDEAHGYYGAWPHPSVLYLNLRENTPPGQARWDQQARPLIARMLKRGLLEWLPCPEARKKNPINPCGKPHLALTTLGKAQLDAWNELGCDAHTHSRRCHVNRRRFKIAS